LPRQYRTFTGDLDMKSTVIPIIRYADASHAIDWLQAAFGLEPFLKVPGADGRIEHARLVLGDGMIAVASLDRQGPFEHRFRSPETAGGVTQAICMMVRDPDQIYQMAKTAGARIIDELADFQFGGRTFSCEDCESHLWVFTSHDHWKKVW
jgi:uncharacterized glyoxalase superfamily protein PhnB